MALQMLLVLGPCLVPLGLSIHAPYLDAAVLLQKEGRPIDTEFLQATTDLGARPEEVPPTKVVQGYTAEEEVERALAEWRWRVEEAVSAAADDNAAFVAFRQAAHFARSKAAQSLSAEIKRDLIQEASVAMAEWQAKEREADLAADAVVTARARVEALRKPLEEAQMVENINAVKKLEEESMQQQHNPVGEAASKATQAVTEEERRKTAEAAAAAQKNEEERKQKEAAEAARKAQEAAAAEASQKAKDVIADAAAHKIEEEHKMQDAEVARKVQEASASEARRKAEAARTAVAAQKAEENVKKKEAAEEVRKSKEAAAEEERLKAKAAEAAAAAQQAEEDYAEATGRAVPHKQAGSSQKAENTDFDKGSGAKNMRHKEFDIQRPGNYGFVILPRGEDQKHAKLYVEARVTPRGPLCNRELFVTGLKLSGRWLHALGGDIELSTATNKFNSPEAVGLKVGNSGNMSLQEFVARIPKRKLVISQYSPERPAKLGERVNTLKMQFYIGPSIVNVGWGHEKVPGGFSNSLSLAVTGLGTEEEVGGLLGVDSDEAAQQPPSACDGAAAGLMAEVPAFKSQASAAV